MLSKICFIIAGGISCLWLLAPALRQRYIVPGESFHDNFTEEELILSETVGSQEDCPSTTALCPAFLLIGERKCGTSSLFHYLLQHPSVLPPKKKEIGYFDKSDGKKGLHLEHYLESNFPSRQGTAEVCMSMVELMEDGTVQGIAPLCKPRHEGVAYVTGEATATYLARAEPQVVAQALPHARLVVILRCPVRRAVSHHAMHLRFKSEGRKARQKVGPLADCLDRELGAWASGKCRSPACAQYLGPGVYVRPLRRWRGAFGRNAGPAVLFTEEMEAASASARALAAFLEPVFRHMCVLPLPHTRLWAHLAGPLPLGSPIASTSRFAAASLDPPPRLALSPPPFPVEQVGFT